MPRRQPLRPARSDFGEVLRLTEQCLCWLGVLSPSSVRAKGGAPKSQVKSLTADLRRIWQALEDALLEDAVFDQAGHVAVDEAAIEALCAAFSSEIERALTAAVKDAVQWGVDEAAEDLGVSISFSSVDASLLGALQGQAVTLCEATAAKIKGDVKGILLESVRLGETLPQAIERLQSASSLSGYEAERIARTELARAANAGRLEGYKDRISHVVWVLGPAYRGGCECAEMAGAYTLDEARSVSMPLHPNCDCYWRPAAADEAEEAATD
ncbi:MAG: hypothetical protein AB1824_01325 [Acidobacteriota bacterium]